MVDKIRPLKIEDTTSGSSLNFVPTETDPAQDYLAGKGFSYEGLDTFLAEKIGRTLIEKTPDDSQKPTYLGNGDIDFIEFFSTASQITANRIAKVTLAYTGINPTTETWLFYATDGTTVLRTITLTHTFSGVNFTNSVQVTT